MHAVGTALDINNAYLYLLFKPYRSQIMLHTHVLLAIVVTLRLRLRLATSLFPLQISAAPSRWAVVL